MMIYIAHPYEGLEENKNKIENILEKIAKADIKNTYNSPVLSYGFLYDKIEHHIWEDYCIDLLMMCDKVYFFGDIKSSPDCKLELKMCKRFKKPYIVFNNKIKD